MSLQKKLKFNSNNEILEFVLFKKTTKTSLVDLKTTTVYQADACRSSIHKFNNEITTSLESGSIGLVDFTEEEFQILIKELEWSNIPFKILD